MLRVYFVITLVSQVMAVNGIKWALYQPQMLYEPKHRIEQIVDIMSRSCVFVCVSIFFLSDVYIARRPGRSIDGVRCCRAYGYLWILQE